MEKGNKTLESKAQKKEEKIVEKGRNFKKMYQKFEGKKTGLDQGFSFI